MAVAVAPTAFEGRRRPHARAGGKSPASLRKNQGGIYLIDCDSLRAALRLAACGRSGEDEGRRRRTWQAGSRVSITAGSVGREVSTHFLTLGKSLFFAACVSCVSQTFWSRQTQDKLCSNFRHIASFFGASVGISQVVVFSRRGN